MAERERFTTTIDGQLLEDIKILAIRRRCSANDLMEEAITDLLKKYKEREQAGDKAEPAKE
jgi:metal-responsive CopG/Arc/MetJ family transcriptional regulator